MTPPLSAQEDTNRRMLRARDEMDRRYAEPLDVPTLAAIAHLSASQFGRAVLLHRGVDPGVPGQDTSILLELVGGPQHDESTAAQVRELVTKGAPPSATRSATTSASASPAPDPTRGTT